MPSGAVVAIGLGLMAAGTVTQMKAARDAAKAQKRQAALQQKRMAIENRQRRLAALKEARYGQSALQNMQGIMGVGSSGMSGAYSASQTQLYTNLGVFGQQLQIGHGIYQQQKKIASAESLAAMGQGMSSFGGFLYGNAGQIGGMLGGMGGGTGYYNSGANAQMGANSAHTGKNGMIVGGV